MSEIIDNPFKDMWEDFNLDEFKGDIESIIDDLYETKDEEERKELVSEFDETVMEFVMMLKFKDVDKLEVIKIENLPPELITYLGMEDEDKMDGWVPKDLIPEEWQKKLFGEVDKKLKAIEKKKNGWLIDKDK